MHLPTVSNDYSCIKSQTNIVEKTLDNQHVEQQDDDDRNALTFYTDLSSAQREVFFELVEGSVSSKWCVYFRQSWLILRYFQILCWEFSEYLQNSYFKEHFWLNYFDFYVLTVLERFLLNFYIDILVFQYFLFIDSVLDSSTQAMDCPSAHRLRGWQLLGVPEVGYKNHWLGVSRNKLKCQRFFSKNGVWPSAYNWEGRVYFHYFKFHVFTLHSSGEYRCYTNFYWRYTYNTTVIDQ